MTMKDEKLLPGLDIPQAHRMVATATGQNAATGVESNGAYPARVALHDVELFHREHPTSAPSGPYRRWPGCYRRAESH